MDLELADRIYECAFAPELWPSVLAELADIATARAGFLFVSNGQVHDWVASNDLASNIIRPFVESGWLAGSERLRRLLAASHAGFVVDRDIYTDTEMQTDPFYRDLLYPRGLGWAAGTAVPLPTGDWFSVNLEREFNRGPVEKSAIRALDGLRPHLARSALIASRLQLERARAASETLGALGLPALLLSGRSHVLVANQLIEAMADVVHWRAHGRVALKDRDADRLLHDAFATTDSARAPSVRSFPVRAPGSETVMIAHVIPIRLSARDIFARCVAALVLTPVTLPQAPPVELVRSLFDLTAAEARVARGLAAGSTVDGIASVGGVSANTIRTHVRRILQKTGCGRQSEVVALLSGVWSPHASGRD